MKTRAYRQIRAGIVKAHYHQELLLKAIANTRLMEVIIPFVGDEADALKDSPFRTREAYIETFARDNDRMRGLRGGKPRSKRSAAQGSARIQDGFH